MTPQEMCTALENAERTCQQLKTLLAVEERNCRHKWSPIKYEPIEHKGYQTHGDPPGTMGVDWQGPCYIPGHTEKIWSRTCLTCGKIEKTQRTKVVYAQSQIAGTSATSEVPEFSS